MTIINLTPHVVNLYRNGKCVMSFEQGGRPVRCTTEYKVTSTINGIPITKTVCTEVRNLPKPKEGIFYIVSRMVAEFCRDRNDLLVPNELIHGESKREILGCQSLTQL